MDEEKGISAGSEDSRISAASEGMMSTIDEKRESEEEDEDIDDGNLKGSKMVVVKKKNNVEEEEDGERVCRIDVKCDEESERVCRICHLSAWESCKSLVDLIQLGCGCKAELAFAHSHCAEAWFKLKGNRICEICGQNAKNMTGVVDNKFMEEWNENRSTGSDSGLSEQSRGCWSGQPLCNFLMACLVIAFVLPWFFRVNMF